MGVWATSTVNQCKEAPKEGGCSKDRCVVVANGRDVILAPGESITAENGEITLLMQTDGNLVLYCPGGVPVWHSNTWYWETENHKRTRTPLVRCLAIGGALCFQHNCNYFILLI